MTKSPLEDILSILELLNIFHSTANDIFTNTLEMCGFLDLEKGLCL